MSGLPERWDETRDRVPGGTSAGERAGEPDISTKEREEILAQIEEAVARARTPLGPEGLRYKSERSGAALPLIVNAVAVLVIAGGALLLSLSFNKTEQSIITRPAAILTAEGQIVGTIKRESEQQLAGRDQEIVRIQGELSQIDGQLRTLKADSAARIQGREQELRAALAVELAAAREKLQKDGASTASIDRQVRAIEERMTRELETELSTFSRQADAELAKKETEINRLFSQYQKSLGDARAEKARLEAEMVSQREQLLTKARGDTAELTEALGSLREQARREQLAADQIAHSYRAVDQAMKTGTWDDAVAALDTLSVYLDGPAVASLPAVQKRKPVELFLIDSLKDIIANRRGGTPVAAAGAETATLLDKAENSYRAGDLAAARESYAEAVRTIPALKTVPDRLAAIVDADRARVRKAVGDAIADGDTAYGAGNYKAALERYGKALDALRDASAALPRVGVRIADAGWRQGFADLVAREDRQGKPLVEKADGLAKAGKWTDAVSAYAAVLRAYPQSTLGPRAVAGVESSVDGLIKIAGDQAAQKERDAALSQRQADDRRKAAAEEKLRAVSDGLSASLRRVGSTAAVAQKELIDLLEAKVKMKEVLGSESVSAQYPGLAAKLDRYIELYGVEKRLEARAATLRDVAAVVDYLDARKTREEVLPLLDRYATETNRAAFQQLLDRLPGLFD